MRFLFIAGCPRSGTTALAGLLNRDERIVLGQERFRNSGGEIEPGDFEAESFFDITERSERPPSPSSGLFPGSPADYDELRERTRSGRVEIMGDKSPFHHRHFERLARAFPGARFVVPWRSLYEVAASYNRRAREGADEVWPPENDWRVAAEHWREAMGDARSFASAAPERIHVLDYRRFYAGDGDEMLDLYGFIGLDPDPAVLTLHAQLASGPAGGRRPSGPEDLSEDERGQLEALLDPALASWLEDRVARQRAG